MDMTYEALAKRIDHSLLPPMLTDAQLAEGCRLAAALPSRERVYQTVCRAARRRYPPRLRRKRRHHRRLSARRPPHGRQGVRG